MKIKTSELSGVQLDWAVKQAIKKDGGYFLPSKNYKDISHAYSWAYGGPIIEREKIGVWWATHYVDDEGQEYGNHWYAETAEGLVGYGPTPLIAAMRCFVASKLGEEVEIPDGLA